jgi:dihydroorotate dehydrogenase (NAD+) catalytic subunit
MTKFDLYLDPPVMNAAGTLGFAPDLRGPVDLSQFGAFVTNPISQAPRRPASGTRYLPTAGGFLLHTGHPNPGLRQVLRKHRRQWGRTSLPVIVHLLALEPRTLAEMVERLEGVEGVMGVEVGLPPGVDASHGRAFIQAAMGELPIIARVNLEQVLAEAGQTLPILEAVIQAGASAISLSAPRGSLPGPDGRIISGRLYGPAVFPLALRAVENIAAAGLPVIASGGVYHPDQQQAMLAAGALAVQLDARLWQPSHPV